MKKILTGMLALLMALVVLSTISPASAATLSAHRSIAGTMYPGSTFTVTVTLDVTGSPVEGLSIIEDLSALPSSWTVSPNNGGVYKSSTKMLEYVWYDQAGELGDKTITYDVSIPGDASVGASCAITGTAKVTPPETTVNIGTDTITVAAPDPNGGDETTLLADRSIAGTMCPGSTFTVTVTLDVTGSPVEGLSIIEDLSALPSSWTVSPNNGGVYKSSTKMLEYVWYDQAGNLDDQTVTYEVAIPSDATVGASYAITGDAKITPPETTVAIATDTVTVADCTVKTLLADRSIAGTMCPGSTFTVTVTLDVTGSPVEGLSIIEDLSALPSSWTVSPNNGGVYKSSTKMLEYVWYDQAGNLDDQTVTYEVAIPSDATVGASYAITGDAMITPPETTVAIGTDTVTVADCSGDVKPQPRITAPADGSTVTGTVVIKAVDDSGEDDIVRAVFEYSTTETSWNKICDDTDGSDGWGCSRDTTAVADDDYTIRVTMYDAADQNGKSAISVSIDNLADPDYELDLDAGLNLVSIPKTINGTNDAETVFSLDPYAGEFCVYYNAFTGGYDVNPDVKQCRGYWVFKNAAETVGVSFDTDAGAVSQQLYEGWNMVGHISLEAVPIYEEGSDSDFGSLTGLEEPEDTKLYRQVCAYTQAGGWEYYPAGDLTDMTPGMGAWILVKQDVLMYGMP